MSSLLDNCWPDWPEWECYVANCAGLVSTALWFIVLLPQVLKNWFRRSVAGLSFLWAVANFTASLVNLFYAFSIEVPLYVRVSAVYMPCLELTILVQFLFYSHKPVTTRLLCCLVCLLVWGCIIELELNLPESKDKIQWVAIALWSIETFPQIVLNIKLQSTSGQSTISVLIALCGKTTDYLVTYGLKMPLPYVIMCYFSSSSAFINSFQVFLYGKDDWFSIKLWKFGNAKVNSSKSATIKTDKDEHTKLLSETTQQEMNCQKKRISEEINCQKNRTSEVANTSHRKLKRCCHWCLAIVRKLLMAYIAAGLIIFAMGIVWRTQSFAALLGPIACCLIVFTANEYYRLKRKGHLRRCEEGGVMLRERLMRSHSFCQNKQTSCEQEGLLK